MLRFAAWLLRRVPARPAPSLGAPADGRVLAPRGIATRVTWAAAALPAMAAVLTLASQSSSLWVPAVFAPAMVGGAPPPGPAALLTHELTRDHPGLPIAILDPASADGAAAAARAARRLALDDPSGVAEAAAAYDAGQPSAWPLADGRGGVAGCLVVPPRAGAAGDPLAAWAVLLHEAGHCLFQLHRLTPGRDRSWPSFQESGAEFFAMSELLRRFGDRGAAYAQAAAIQRDAWYCGAEAVEPYAREAYDLGPAIRLALAGRAAAERSGGTGETLRLAEVAAHLLAKPKWVAPSAWTARCKGR